MARPIVLLPLPQIRKRRAAEGSGVFKDVLSWMLTTASSTAKSPATALLTMEKHGGSQVPKDRDPAGEKF